MDIRLSLSNRRLIALVRGDFYLNAVLARSTGLLRTRPPCAYSYDFLVLTHEFTAPSRRLPK